MIRRLVRLLPVVLATAAPGTIHLACHQSTATRDAMALAMVPASQGIRVKTDDETWNDLQSTGPSYSFTNIPLLSSDGTSSGALVSGSTGYIGNAGINWAAMSKDAVMMEGWFGLRGTEAITVSGLPAEYSSGFHVIVYGDSNEVARTMNYTIGGATRTIQDSGTFNGTFAEGANHTVFTGLSGSGFTLTGNAATSPRSAVNGISIIPGDPLPPLAIASFTADRGYVTPGETVTLSWSASGAESFELSPGIGPVAGTSAVVTPGTTTTYTLTARRGTESATATVRVGAGPSRPNLLLVLVDDMGAMDTSVPFYYDSSGQPVVTPLNQRYRTPNMASLAASGMKFTSAYACNVCTPSRVSLMTGLNATRHHVTTWTALASPQDTGDSATAHNLVPPADWRKAGIDPAATTLPRLLQAAGYRTIHTGKGHFGPNSETVGDPRMIGFDRNIAGSALGGPGSYLGTQNFVKSNPAHQVPGLQAYHGQEIFLTEALTREMTREIAAAATDQVPFFAYLSHYAVHATFEDADPRFTANYPQLGGYEKNFATLVEGMDRSLGDVLQRLRDLGQAANTLVVFTGDNGTDAPIPFGAGQIGPAAPFRGKKTHAYEGGLRVPLLVSWAERDATNPFQQRLPIPAGGVCHDMTLIWDLMPTLLGTAGLEIPAGLDGHDLAPYLRGEPGTHRPQEFVLNFPHSHQYEDFYVMMRSGPWKLIYRYLTKSYELYNLANDTGEQSNLASHPGHAARLMSLSRRMIRRLGELDYQPPRERLVAGNPESPPVTLALVGIDSDGDGLADLAEDPNRNGLIDPGETDPDAADSDSDGTPDGAETRLGLDPVDGASRFLSHVRWLPEKVVLSWPSHPGTTFSIHGSGDLRNWSQVIASGLPAAAEPARQTTYEISPPPAGPRFFRVTLD